jgi:hypothetical protein
MNETNYRRVLEHIKAHPETWEQSNWHCGTQHCIAGWSQIFAGKTPDDFTVRRDARQYLQISVLDADWLFAPHRTIADFDSFLLNGSTEYDEDGYDKDELDCNFMPRHEVPA